MHRAHDAREREMWATTAERNENFPSFSSARFYRCYFSSAKSESVSRWILLGRAVCISQYSLSLLLCVLSALYSLEIEVKPRVELNFPQKSCASCRHEVDEVDRWFENKVRKSSSAKSLDRWSATFLEFLATVSFQFNFEEGWNCRLFTFY